MKLKLRWACLLLVINIAVWCSYASAFQRPAPNAPLDNAAVVKLVRAGFRDKAVISIIASREVHFDLSTDQLIELKKHGVSEKVILAMIGRAQGDMISADDIAMDDSMDFPPLTSQGSSQGQGPGQTSGGDSTNIFGSSGGSRGRSKSNSGSAGIDNDTVTTGSATVRIVRPPSESGGAPSPKLERTPTLTNDSIADLVQAGFSEGTIIRRIQNSPVDFDLSAKKIDNLHQRHVTDPIIDAMRAAMADDGSSPTGQVNPKR